MPAAGKRFLLFGQPRMICLGGFADLRASYRNIEAARLAAADIERAGGWWQIYDTVTMSVVIDSRKDSLDASNQQEAGAIDRDCRERADCDSPDQGRLRPDWRSGTRLGQGTEVGNSGAGE